MLIKANVSFAGDIVMRKGEERELEAYVSEVKADDGKHSNARKRKAEPEN